LRTVHLPILPPLKFPEWRQMMERSGSERHGSAYNLVRMIVDSFLIR